jgi:hypothetical protein
MLPSSVLEVSKERQSKPSHSPRRPLSQGRLVHQPDFTATDLSLSLAQNIQKNLEHAVATTESKSLRIDGKGKPSLPLLSFSSFNLPAYRLHIIRQRPEPTHLHRMQSDGIQMPLFQQHWQHNLSAILPSAIEAGLHLVYRERFRAASHARVLGDAAPHFDIGVPTGPLNRALIKMRSHALKRNPVQHICRSPNAVWKALPMPGKVRNEDAWCSYNGKLPLSVIYGVVLPKK